MKETYPPAPANYKGRHRQLAVTSSGRGYRQHAHEASGMYLGLPAPGDRELLAQKRDYRELMTHDGTKTYLVHSTRPGQVEKIFGEGLKALGTADNPGLESTVVMLAGPDDKEQVAKNAFNLAYQYDGGDTDDSGADSERTAKIVVEIPKPTPDIKLGRDTFQGTHLAEADGENIVNLGRVDADTAGHDTLYGIPAGRVMGYIDSSTSDMAWVSNPNFEPSREADQAAQQALGHVALN